MFRGLHIRALIVVLIIVLFIPGCGVKEKSGDDKIPAVNLPPVQSDDKPGDNQQVAKPEPQIITLQPGDFGVTTLAATEWAFTTEPVGANVYLNSKLIGTTPFVMKQLPPAGTVLSVIKEGYGWFHLQIGREKPGAQSINLIPGNWASPGEIEQALKDAGIELKSTQNGYWQGDLGHMQLEQFQANPAGDRALMVIERRIPENAEPHKVTTLVKTLALLELSSGVKTRVLEQKPYYVGYDQQGIWVLHWLDDERVLFLEGMPDPEAKDPFLMGMAFQVLNVVNGEKKLIKWVPSHRGIYVYDTWLSENKDELYYKSEEGFYRGAIGALNLSTGEERIIKKDLRLYRPYDELLLVKSPGGNGVIHLLNPGKDVEIKIFDLPTGKEARLTPQGVVSTDPVWSPDSNHIAFKVGEAGENHALLYTEGGAYLEASSIWVTTATGERVARLSLAGKHPGAPQWLPESGDLVFQVLERVKIKPEEVVIEGEEWRIACREIYRANIQGEMKKLYTPAQFEYRLEEVLNEKWLLLVDDHQNRPRYVLLSTVDGSLIPLAPDTRRVLGMAQEKLLTWDEKKSVILVSPGEPPRTVITLNDYLMNHYIIKDKWLFLIDKGTNFKDPAVLKLVSLE